MAPLVRVFRFKAFFCVLYPAGGTIYMGIRELLTILKPASKRGGLIEFRPAHKPHFSCDIIVYIGGKALPRHGDAFLGNNRFRNFFAKSASRLLSSLSKSMPGERA